MALRPEAVIFEERLLSSGLGLMSGKRGRVLVAEDEYVVRLLVVDDLTSSGLEVIEAADGLEAIEALERGERIDALVANLKMPGANGIAVAAAARERFPEIPIVFTSATPQILRSNPTLAPYHCLAKPFETSDLVILVQRLLTSG